MRSILRLNSWKAGGKLVGQREKLKWDAVTIQLISADPMGSAEAEMALQRGPEMRHQLSLVINVGCPGECITCREAAPSSQGQSQEGAGEGG